MELQPLVLIARDLKNRKDHHLEEFPADAVQ